MNRRRLLGAGAASVAAMTMPGRLMAQDKTAAPMELVAGGGAVETELGMVDFGLAVQAGAAGELTGSFSLRDFTLPGNPVIMQATQLNRLEPYDADQPSARQLVGWVSAGGESALFVLRVNDVDGPGSGKDAFALAVGEAAAPLLEGEEQQACDCADYSYGVEGTVVHGDIMVVAP